MHSKFLIESKKQLMVHFGYLLKGSRYKLNGSRRWPTAYLTKSRMVNEKTTRSQYLMRANLNVRPLVDIAQFDSGGPEPRAAHVWGRRPRRFPEKRKKEEKNKNGVRDRVCVREKNADIMQVIIIIIGDRRPRAPPLHHPIFIQMCSTIF